jgi:predicted metalloprotease with PDZ domain
MKRTLSAPANFDVLYDSPFLVSRHTVIGFQVRGIEHRFVIDGTGNFDAEQLRADIPKIIEASAALFGDLPYENYTFMLMTHPTARGGLEHLNSTALIWRRFDFRPAVRYKDFLSLVAHEFFHLWNVKRIRPDALGPFDYTAENYTRLLWVAEGFTSYYENLLLRRAGILTDREYLDTLAPTIATIQRTPGRLALSVEEASFDAWIKYYRQDENSINNQVSYYDKGALIGMLLDLEIRRRTAGARSLDDVMRLLYTDFAKRERNYTPEDFQRTAERIAGASLDAFFSKYVRGTAELPYDELFTAFGLTLDRTGGRAAPRPSFGATLTQTGDRLNVTNVPSDSPAYTAGINAGDQILAIDGNRVTLEAFNARINERKPGDTAQITVFRNDELRTIPVKIGTTAEGTYRILATPTPTDEQRKLYEGWLGTQLGSLATPARAEED